MDFVTTVVNQLVMILGRVGPVEVIDVVAVAFILYQLLRLVRGTQATQLIVGLVVLGIIGLAATRLNLILLGWLFRNAAPIAVLAIVVLFQPELRRILDQVGRIGHLGRPLSAFNPQLFNRSIAEAIRAAERLAGRRIGALIAFDREVGLEDYAATGVRINGELSAEFLQSISGGISVVENGRITRNLDPDGLRRRLTGGLETASPTGNGRSHLLGWRLTGPKP